MYDQDCESYWELSDFLPVDTVVDYWCNGSNPTCKEAKKHALLTALERKDVKYRRSDGKDFVDPIYYLYEQRLLLIERESFLSWAQGISGEAEKQNLRSNMAIGPKSETTYLNIIGAMLHLMLSQSPGGQRYSSFTTQTAIIEKILAHHPNKPGISQRTIEDKFAAANREISST